MAAIRTRHIPGTPGLTVDEAGTGELVLFMHGIGGNRTNWTRQVQRFGDHYLAVAWDARGYNGSEDYDGPLDFSDFSRDILRLLKFYGRKKVHLVGLSMGGRIAQDFYALFPQHVATLTIVASFTGFQNFSEADRQKFLGLRLKPLVEEGKEPRDIAPIVAKTLCSANATEAQYQQLVASMAALHKGSYIKTVTATTLYNRTAELAKIAVPTLLVFGEADTLTTAAMGEEMHGRIKGAQLVIVPKSGHLVNLEQPDAFEAALEPFLFAHRGRADARKARRRPKAGAKAKPAAKARAKAKAPKRRAAK
ncbi:MAG: alpha/beta hydrolase [Rhodospirillaceae bacterium]|nr:alpha/beta hydrolase [Rhodospirillaceae bacterium]